MQSPFSDDKFNVSINFTASAGDFDTSMVTVTNCYITALYQVSLSNTLSIYEVELAVDAASAAADGTVAITVYIAENTFQDDNAVYYNGQSNVLHLIAGKLMQDACCVARGACADESRVQTTTLECHPSNSPTTSIQISVWKLRCLRTHWRPVCC